MTESVVSDSPELRKLRPSDFSFFGYDGLSRPIERHIEQVELRGGAPTAAVIDGAVYAPGEQSGLIRGRRGESVANFADPSLPPAQEIDEEVVYLGWLFNHYGHFLMQSLARTWFLSQVDPSVRVVFHHSGRSRQQPAGWALRILDAFGVPPQRMLVLDAPTRLRRLIVPEPFFEPRGIDDDHKVRAHEAMARPYQAVAERIAGDAAPTSQPLYLSRRFLPPSQRTIVGEDELEDLLRENGFRIAHTEKMSFQDQVRLINEHEDIFSNAGSAAHNVLFARHRPRLHLLTNGAGFSPDYFLYATVSQTPTSFVNCLNTGDRQHFKRGYKVTPHLLDLETIVAYLDRHGFLTQPVASRLSGYEDRNRGRYDEAWLYGYARFVGRRDALPPAVEEEASTLAATAWPVSLALARYFADRDPARVEAPARQFADLAAAERDAERLERHRTEVADMVPAVAQHAAPDTARRLTAVVADRFGINLESPAQGAPAESGQSAAKPPRKDRSGAARRTRSTGREDRSPQRTP